MIFALLGGPGCGLRLNLEPLAPPAAVYILRFANPCASHADAHAYRMTCMTERGIPVIEHELWVGRSECTGKGVAP